MTLVEHAKVILGFLANRRNVDDRISAITNVKLIRSTINREPSDFAVTYGQANSLLDLACLEAGLPFIGRLVMFDHSDDSSNSWKNWGQFESLLYHSAPRLKRWSDADITLIQQKLRPGNAADLWSKIKDQSEELLNGALVTAQQTVKLYVDECMPE